MTDFVDLMVTQSSEKNNEQPIKVAVKVSVKKKNTEDDVTNDEIKEWESILEQVKPGVAVMHNSFGKGTVVSLKESMKKIEIQFKSGKKIFLFPDAFINGFLSLADK
jgi:hypothetical protein